MKKEKREAKASLFTNELIYYSCSIFLTHFTIRIDA